MIRDRVQYVPAGLEAWTSVTGQAYVKLEKNKEKSIMRGPGYKEVRLHDRTIYIIQNSTKLHRLIDKKLDCDYMVPFQNPVELEGRIGLVLVNPVHADKSFHNIFRPHGIKIISDSGGFQMLRGIVDFVHPKVPVKFYNEHTDIGMPLDLPMRTALEPVFFDAVTRMMKANDAYMLPRLKEGVQLAVVSHGSSVEMRKRRLDAIYRPTPVIAIAGLNTLTDTVDLNKNITALTNALYVISQTRDTTDYYHFLGVTSRFWFIIYALLAGTGYVKSCGGDSVSHRMAAITGMYKHQLTYDGGRALTIKKINHHSVNTACPCSICVGFSDLNLLANFQYSESHHIWYAEQEKDLICDSVENYLAGKLTLKAIADQWLAAGQYEILAYCVEYVERVVRKGFFQKATKTKGLFEKAAAPIPEAAREHYTKVIRNYEKFHKKRFLK